MRRRLREDGLEKTLLVPASFLCPGESDVLGVLGGGGERCRGGSLKRVKKARVGEEGMKGDLSPPVSHQLAGLGLVW